MSETDTGRSQRSSRAPRSLVVEADGGSRGNPGVAGYGALVRDPASGVVLLELAEPLGKASNNVAEYSGLIAGLRAVLDLDPAAQVTARLDSKLVVEQMAGRWKIKHEDMRRLALVARDLCGEISNAGGSVDFEWIPREKNKAADALSNEAMDGHSVHRVPVVSGEQAGPLESAAGSAVDGSPQVDTREALRLVLVECPRDSSQAAGVAHAVAALTSEPRVIMGRGLLTDDTLVELEAALVGAIETDDGWDAPPGTGADHSALSAYHRLVRTGGEAVVVTSRRGVLTVLAAVLGTPLDRFETIASAPGSLTGVQVWPDGTGSVAFTNRTDHLG